jgi:hypothetical protein
MKHRLVFFMAAPMLLAQDPAAPIFLWNDELTRLKAAKAANNSADATQAITDLVTNLQRLAAGAGNTNQSGFRALTDGQLQRRWNMLRLDQQSGSSGGSGSGSTSVTLLPALEKLLGFSLETGSILKSVSGTTTSIRVNPAKLFCVAKEGAVNDRSMTECQETLSRFSLALAFDTSRKVPDNQGLNARISTLSNQFSEARLNFNLLSTSEEKRLAGRRQKAVAELRGLSEGTLVLETQVKPDTIRKWKTDTAAKLQAAAAADVESVWAAAIADFQRELRANPASRRTSELIRASLGNSLDKMLAIEQAKAAKLAMEFAIVRPDVATMDIANGIVQQGRRPPALASARLIGSRGFGMAQLTGNASANWFTDTRPGMRGAFRDWQVSGQAALRLVEINDWGAAMVSFGGLFGDIRQRPLGIDLMTVNPLTGDSTKLNQPGRVGLFQFRFELPTAQRNVVIPFSLTYSNRTDLIKEEDVKASIGITIRFDSIFPRQ